jgi:hypothetical protein
MRAKRQDATLSYNALSVFSFSEITFRSRHAQISDLSLAGFLSPDIANST